MATDRCDVCRHEVPAGRWCNRCGAQLVPGVHHRSPGRWQRTAVAVGIAVVATIGGLAVTVGDPTAPPGPSDDTEVALDGTAAGPAPAPSNEPPASVTVERPGGAPIPPPRGCSPAPGGRELRTNMDCSYQRVRTEVVCSDLRVRSVPSAQLATTREGALVELGHGTCVVMGREGSTAR